MTARAPVSYHLDLYRYWDAKRQGRAMPARSDLDPSEIRKLLPHLTLIERVEQRFRYRLVGTTASEELGRDLTGGFVGDYVNPPEYAAAVQAIFARVFATGRPLFTTGEYRSASQAIHAISRLMLPLGDDGTNVNMVIFTRIARFSRNVTADLDWLKGAPGKVCDIDDVASADDVAARSAVWERACLTDEAA